MLLINSNKKLFSNSDFAYYILGKAYEDKKKYKESFVYLNKAINLNPENLSYKLELARLCIEKNDYNRAKKELNLILKQNLADSKFNELAKTELYWLRFKADRSDENKSQYNLAKYYAVQGDYQTASDIIEKIISDKTDNSNIWELAGDINLWLDKREKAEHDYNQALKFNKDNVKAMLGLGHLLLMQGNYKEALLQYNKAFRIKPDDSSVLVALANAYKYSSNDEMAKQYFSLALKYDSNNSKASYNLGLIFLKENDEENAEKFFKKALSVNSFDVDSWLALASLKIEQKNFFLARTYLSPVNSIDQQNPEYYYLSALIDKNNEDYSAARINIKKALNLKPDYYEATKVIKELE